MKYSAKKVVAGICLLSLATNIARALDLGDAISQSTLHQPLDISVELDNLAGVNPHLVTFRQATEREYSQFFLDEDATKYTIRPVQLYEKNGQTFVRLLSNEPTVDEELTIILVAQWAGGMRYKAYSFTFNQPVELAQSAPTPRVAQVTEENTLKEGANRTFSSPETEFRGMPQKNTGGGAVLNSTDNEPQQELTAKNTSGGAVLQYGDAPAMIVRKGSTLWSIAGDLAGAGTRHQKMIAIYQANPQAFIDGNINLIKSGAKLVIPSEGQLAQVSPKIASEEFARLVSRYSKSGAAVAATRRKSGDLSGTSAQSQKVPQSNKRVLTITQTDNERTARDNDSLGNSLEGSASSGIEALQNRIDITEQGVAAAAQNQSNLKQSAKELNDTLGARESIINLPSEINNAVDEIVENKPFQSNQSDIAEDNGTSTELESTLTKVDDAANSSIFADAGEEDVADDKNAFAIRDSLDVDYEEGTASQNSGNEIPKTDDTAVDDRNGEGGVFGWLFALGGLLLALLWWFFKRRKGGGHEDYDQFEYAPVLKGHLDLKESESLIASANMSLDNARRREAGDKIEELVDRKTPHIMATIELIRRFADLGNTKRARLLVLKLNDLELTTKEEAALEELQDDLSSVGEPSLIAMDELPSESEEERQVAVEEAEKYAKENNVNFDGVNTESQKSNLSGKESAGLAAGFAALVSSAIGANSGTEEESNDEVGPIVEDLSDDELSGEANSKLHDSDNADSENSVNPLVEDLVDNVDADDLSEDIAEDANDEMPGAAAREQDDSLEDAESNKGDEDAQLASEGDDDHAEDATMQNDGSTVSYDDEFNQDVTNQFESDGGLPMTDDADVYNSRLDLAKAYFEMGDIDTAEALLQPVIANGSSSQVSDAQNLLEKYTG